MEIVNTVVIPRYRLKPMDADDAANYAHDLRLLASRQAMKGFRYEVSDKAGEPLFA